MADTSTDETVTWRGTVLHSKDYPVPGAWREVRAHALAVQIPDAGIDTSCVSRFLLRHAYQLSQYTYGQCPWLLRQRSTRVINTICPTTGAFTILLYGPQ